MPALIPSDENYDRKVLNTFLVDGRIKQLPVQRKKREVILRYLIPNFEGGRVYRESEVNDILRAFHEDVATLLREMVATGLLVRYRGEYARPE